MSYTLFPHQSKVVPMLQHGSSVLNWEMRTGKTRPVLHAFNELLEAGQLRDLVVVAPKTGRAVWKEEAEDMGLQLPFCEVYGKTKRVIKGSYGDHPRVFLLNPQLLSSWTSWLQGQLKPERFALVADESHLFLRRAAGRSDVYTAFEALSMGSDHVWELSGTWMVKSALDIYWQLRMLGGAVNPFHYTKLKRFAERYCNVIPNPYNSYSGVEYDGIQNEDELMDRLSGVVSTVLEEEVRAIPGIDRFPVWVDDDGEDWPRWLEDAEIDEMQRAIIPRKIALTKAYLEDLRIREELDEAEPIVIFGWHREYTEGLAELLGCPVIHGGSSEQQRTRIRHTFASRKMPVLVGNLMSLGMSVDLSAARHFIYGEPSAQAYLHLQAEARGRGPKQRSRRLLHHYLLIRGGVDENVWRSRLERGQAIERLSLAGRDAGRGQDHRIHEEVSR